MNENPFFAIHTLAATKPSSSTSNSPKMSSTSAWVNLSPHVLRACVNIDALILRASSPSPS